MFFKRKKEEKVPSLFSSLLEKKWEEKNVCPSRKKKNLCHCPSSASLWWRCLAVSSAEMRVQVIIDRLVAPLKNEKGRKKGTVFSSLFLNGVEVVLDSQRGQPWQLYRRH